VEELELEKRARRLEGQALARLVDGKPVGFTNDLLVLFGREQLERLEMTQGR